MLDVIRFVQGAVAKKDYVPALQHFRIKNNRITGFNGTLAISAPIELGLDVAPMATQFVKAIGACKERISLALSANGKLVVKSGAFKTNVDCIELSAYPDIAPGGRIIELRESILPAIKFLDAFVGQDASRPWACGILFSGQSAFATNNIVLLEYWLGFDFPFQINIPSSAIRELVRINEDPCKLQMTEDRIVFHYPDGRWLSSQLIRANWPDVTTLLGKHAEIATAPFPVGFWDALEQMLPFVDEMGKCYMQGDKMATTPSSDAAGASVATACPSVGIYNARQLMNLKGIVDKVGFEAYPQPVPFFGPKTRGIIVGIRS